jgi:hypothetical protein
MKNGKKPTFFTVKQYWKGVLQFGVDTDPVFQTQLYETHLCYSGLEMGLIPECFLFNEATSSALKHNYRSQQQYA